MARIALMISATPILFSTIIPACSITYDVAKFVSPEAADLYPITTPHPTSIIKPAIPWHPIYVPK